MKKLRTTQKIIVATFIVGVIVTLSNLLFILPLYGAIGKDSQEANTTLNRSTSGIHALKITLYICIAVIIVTAVVDYSQKHKK